ncbi:hypothetical protein C8E89_101407 [Mycolicibacterium moriokaense]|uniref:Uncharacterized protein n=1 Tax=Mycolicibacterium moriokaense TaxID=39691 RepID=A0A318HNH4_9MYCO|nr:hypothetical protein C8E89_101407 [Mycolicibacterium moriokaense]
MILKPGFMSITTESLFIVTAARASPLYVRPAESISF